MNPRRFLAASALLLCAALPAAAQEAPPADDDIVVTGRALEPKEVIEQARDVTAQQTRGDPLARFEKPVCPGVAGLKDDYGLAIAERMRFNAERLGLSLGDAADCEANVLVVFVSGLDEVMAKIFDDDALVRANFSTLTARERRLLKNERGPTRAWSLTTQRSADGFLATVGKVMEIRDIGRINIGSREDMEVSMVLIDLAATRGLTTQQLADYATMRALARTREPEEDGALSTILALFSPTGADVDELTSFDLAYLDNLYSGAANVAGSRKLRGIADAVDRGSVPR